MESATPTCRCAGSIKRFRSSASLRPSLCASTVTQRALNPCASAVRTHCSTTPRSLRTSRACVRACVDARAFALGLRESVHATWVEQQCVGVLAAARASEGPSSVEGVRVQDTRGLDEVLLAASHRSCGATLLPPEIKHT